MSIIRTAPAPTRATSSVVLSAGLINIPLSVYTAVESTTVERQEFYKGNPDVKVGRAPIRYDTGFVIDKGDITRMAQATDGTWVVLTDDEINDCVGLSGGCEVVSFVPVKDAGQYLTNGLYQVRVKNEKRGGTAAIEAFSLLIAGMKARKVHALVKFALRGAPRYALLTADGDLLLIATADAVREELPLLWMKHTKAEVDMVTSLIDAIGIDTPVLTDDIAVAVQTYVNDKAVKGGKPSVHTPTPAPAGELVDIVGRLQASIDAVKAKPSKGKKVA